MEITPATSVAVRPKPSDVLISRTLLL